MGMMPPLGMLPGAMMMIALRDAVMKQQKWTAWPVGKEWVRTDGKKYASEPTQDAVLSLARAKPAQWVPTTSTQPTKHGGKLAKLNSELERLTDDLHALQMERSDESPARSRRRSRAA